jgi:hypothetical protein
LELPNPDIPENYIGYRFNFRDLPSGLENLGGRILRDDERQYELSIHELGWHENKRLILLQKFICRDESGRAYFEVVDAFGTPLLNGKETKPWVCFEGDREVQFTGGLGLYDDSVPMETIGDYEGWPYTKILFLYYADLASQQFILFDVQNVKCLEGGGPGSNH